MLNLSKIEKEFLVESNLIEGETEDIKQASLAWEFVRGCPKLTHEVITSGHKILMADKPYPSPLGYYRSVIRTNVWVGGKLAPSWAMVDGLMDNWLLDHAEAKTESAIKEAHIRLEGIHPFADG